jgi:hypothetical protein
VAAGSERGRGDHDEGAREADGQRQLAATVRAAQGVPVLDVDEPSVAEAPHRRVGAPADLDGERFDRDVERHDRPRPPARARSSVGRCAGMQYMGTANQRPSVGAAGTSRVNRRPPWVQHEGRLVTARRWARVQPARTGRDDLDETRARERGARTGREVPASRATTVTAELSRDGSRTDDRPPRHDSNRSLPG